MIDDDDNDDDTDSNLQFGNATRLQKPFSIVENVWKFLACEYSRIYSRIYSLGIL